MPTQQTTLFGGEAQQWVAYTDGGAAPKNPGPAAWGAVILAPNPSDNLRLSAFIGHATNQVAELTGALEAISRIPLGAHVKLVVDSQYVQKGLTEWRKGWIRNGWKNSKGEPVANMELWKRLYAAADARKLTVQWVKAHTGRKDDDSRYNEEADCLVNAARAYALKNS